jgi:cyclopropane fatty-acyl-phospholipid synthase-like methyltransferase
MTDLPFSDACERNREPILEALLQVFPGQGRVLEIGSCTGQHVVFLAPFFPGLTWQPSDQLDYLGGLAARIRQEGSPNILEAVELDVMKAWPEHFFDAVYSSNTAHIMCWGAVCAMFQGVGRILPAGGVFCLYGPFNESGRFTSPSNEEFDRSLRLRDPAMGIRDLDALDTLAQGHQMKLQQQFLLPANNRLLVFRKNKGGSDD